jgi:hypothetical protein
MKSSLHAHLKVRVPLLFSSRFCAHLPHTTTELLQKEIHAGASLNNVYISDSASI